MDGSRRTRTASLSCRGATSEKLFSIIKKLHSDETRGPGPRLSEPLLETLKLGPDSPFTRHYISGVLLPCVACLEKGTRSAFLFSIGFSRDITGSSEERVSRSAAVSKMGRRTLYHHVEKTTHEIIHLLLADDHVPVPESIDFVTMRTRYRLDLRNDSPTILMDCMVMALRDNFDALDEHLFLPLLRDELRCYVLEEYRLAGVQDTGDSWIIQLRLPRHLNVREPHTFSVFVHLPDHDYLKPVFGLAPVTSMHATRIELRFGARPPNLIERTDYT